MQFDLLCSGSKGNSCLIRHNGHSILIDCGPSTKKYMVQSLKEAGSSLEEIEAVLVTHSHGDHVRQLPLFRHLPVYAPCELNIKDRNRNLIPFHLHTVQMEQPFMLFDLTVTPVTLSHDAGPTAGYIIEDGKDKLVYITDTGYVNRKHLPLMKNATWYIFESNHDVDMLMECSRPMAIKQRIFSDLGHLNNIDSAQLLASLIGPDTRQVVLAHLSQEANTPSRALATHQEIYEARGIDMDSFTLVAADQFQLTSSLPSKIQSEAKTEKSA